MAAATAKTPYSFIFFILHTFSMGINNMFQHRPNA